MLNQALEVFKREYEKAGNSLILDSYIPTDGTYVIVVPNGDSFEVDDIIDIKLDKKTMSIDRTISKHFKFICHADYFSSILNNNKPISNKIISSNNYLSFFIKKDNIANKLDDGIIDDYYNFFKNPCEKYNGATAELYKNVESEVGVVNEERLNKIREWTKLNIYGFAPEKTEKGYLKIFFLYHYEEYKKGSKRYFIPKIYVKNDYNTLIKDRVCGMPNDNMGLNSKKPYLENKTRKEIAPYLIGQEEVLLQKKFFDYLLTQCTIGKNNIYIDDNVKAFEDGILPEEKFKGIYLRIRKHQDKIKTEAEILDFDIIPMYKPKLIKEFEYNNVLGLDYDTLKGEYGKVKTLKGMQKIINQVLFNNLLITNYFTEAKMISIKDTVLKSNLLILRMTLFGWFYKGIDNNVWQVLNKVSLSIVKNSITKEYMTNAYDQFNLRISLKDYFEEDEKMADIIFDMKESLKRKVNNKDNNVFIKIENDREYYFAVGQLVRFFISKSKAKKKPLSFINQFISVKKDRIIKYKLELLFKRYNYGIEGFRFNNLYKIILGYQPSGKVDEDMIISGYLHSNLLYEKDGEGKSNE